jgi:hypothetical protein
MTALFNARQFVGGLDLLGAFVMLWANQKITTSAGLRSPQARWALTRRFIYCCVAAAWFILGTSRVFGIELPLLEAAAQVALVVGFIAFPLLRATGWITQDTFFNVHGFNQPYQNGHRRHQIGR